MEIYCFQRRFPGWTLLLINFLPKLQGGRLFQRGRLLIFAKFCVILDFSYNLLISSCQTYLLYPSPPSSNNQETMKFQKPE